MKNKILKMLIAISLIAVMILPLASCGTGNAGAPDANGEWKGITWSYKKETATLTLTLSGDMPDAKHAAEVGWASVKTSVQKVRILPTNNAKVEHIGDHAFYGMTKLTDVSLPDEVKSIGKCAFAFCSSLKSIKLPEGLQTIEVGAFEACISLQNAELPASVSRLGERAFAFCKALKTVNVKGVLGTVGEWTFKDCTSLQAVRVLKANLPNVNGKAFEGASISKMTTVATAEELTPSDKNEAPAEPEAPAHTEPPATEAPTESDAPTENTKEKGFTLENIAGVAVLAIVIIGIIVGAVLLMRSGKNDGKAKKNSVATAKKSNAKGKKK